MYQLSNYSSVLLMSFFLLMLSSLPAFADKDMNDKRALTGVKEVRAIYDVQVKEPKRFTFFLDVIGKTYDGIMDQGIQPKFVVAVRGPAIRFVSNEIWSFSEEDQKYLEDAARLIGDLKRRGVRFEACSIAAGLFKINHQSYLKGVDAVSNTFISLTGYQAQGYGLVPVN